MEIPNINTDFIDLFGNDSAKGVQVHPLRFWSCFSGPIGTEADYHRTRLMAAYSTIPLILRSRFLSRLHSENTPSAIGAWAELEFVHLVTKNGMNVLWTDEQDNSIHGRRSLDMIVQGCEKRLHAEVTHCREEPLPPNAKQIFSFFGREQVPAGVYALTIGTGQPPIKKIRNALRHVLTTSPSIPLDVQVQDWSIQQLTPQTSVVSIGTEVAAPQIIPFTALIDRVGRILRKKRHQAREVEVQDVLLAIVILDRNASDFLEFATKQPEVLASLFGSISASSDVLIHAIAIGAVPSDSFPPVPKWTLVIPEDSPIKDKIGIDVPTIRVSLSKQFHQHGKSEEQTEGEPEIERSVYYATRTLISAASSPELETESNSVGWVSRRMIAS